MQTSGQSCNPATYSPIQQLTSAHLWSQLLLHAFSSHYGRRRTLDTIKIRKQKQQRAVGFTAFFSSLAAADVSPFKALWKLICWNFNKETFHSKSHVYKSSFKPIKSPKLRWSSHVCAFISSLKLVMLIREAKLWNKTTEKSDPGVCSCSHTAGLTKTLGLHKAHIVCHATWKTKSVN